MLLAEWTYTTKEWNDFVTTEIANKKEDNIYFGIGIAILGTVGLMLLRGVNLITGVLFSVPLAVLIPFLRMKFSYKHLKKGEKNPRIKIFTDCLIVNKHKIELTSSRKRVKSAKIITSKNNKKLLEIDVQWLTAKGPTNDEFRIPIPSEKEKEAQNIILQLS